MSEASRRGLHVYRRWFQLAFLLLFLALLTLTVWPLGSVFLGAFLVGDPLIAMNSAINGVLRPEMWLAVVMILVPLVAGRAFCGYVCPMGAIVEWATPKRRGPGLSERARDRWRKIPVFVLLVSAGMLLFASGAFLVLDPLATLTRTATTLLFPFADRMLRLAGDLAYLAAPLRDATDAVTTALSGRLIYAEPRVYALAFGVLGAFAGILALNLAEPRFWCRHLCPLGALLGLVGRLGIRNRTVDAEACIACGACERVCPLDAVRDEYLATDTSRCQLCLLCADACPTDAIAIGTRPQKSLYVPSRRTFLAGAAAGLLAGFFTFTGHARRALDPHLVRPPGARSEDDLLALCTRCGQCMKVCPTNVLQPSLSKSGAEGFFTPEMDYRIGSCDWTCAECGKVCPTGAIMPLTLAEKRTTVLGRAYIDTTRCIPWADYESCLVCQELCPVPEKAIVFTEDAVTTPEGVELVVKRPHVVAERCIGCGVCEWHCPVPRESAIRVRGLDA
ncbi:MAG: 4Fe-4S binding protein [Coriobacteriia bacterium]|nr:4Fe-4S binding protein [Coriobacteriia bacterium]